jgi:hypothetical protein
MELIADALLIAGALGAAVYCRTLSRRLGALKDLDSGLGAAIAALSRQVDEMRASLEAAKSVSGDQTREVAQLTARAEMAAGRLELLLASLHEGGQRRPVGQQAAAGRPERAPARRTEQADDETLFGGDDEAVLEAIAGTLARRAAGVRAAGQRPSAPGSRNAGTQEDDRAGFSARYGAGEP